MSDKFRLLFLTSNPVETTRLNLEEEMRDVKAAIKGGANADSWELQLEPAMRIADLQRVLDDYKPNIVHFCGHGSAARGQLVFLDDQGNAQPVPLEPLARLLGSVEGVVLNACNSVHQAKIVGDHGAWAIGMNGPISTTHATIFAQTFYRKLANGSSVQQAFDGAKLQLELEGHQDAAALPALFSGVATLDTSGTRVSVHSQSPLPAILNPFGAGDVGDEIGLLPDLYFSDTDFSRKAKSERISVIVGRRGAGKTTLAQWLGLPRIQNTRHYPLYVDIGNPALFAPHATGMAESLKNENHAAESLALVWKTALLHALMVDTLRDGKLARRSTNSLLMASHLRDHRIPETQSSSHVVQRVFRIVEAGRSPGISSATSILESVQKLEQSPGYDEWLKALYPFLKETRQRAVIVIDTLEEYRVSDRAVQISLAALAHSVTELSKQSVGQNLEIKLFLPAEVSQSIEETSILNVGKTFERAMFLHWRRKDLLRMICWRLAYFMSNRYSELCPKELRGYQGSDWTDHAEISKRVWLRFFPDNDSTDHIGGSFAHLSRFTQLRPRQFVVLCNSIAQVAYEEGSFPAITYSHIDRGIARVIDLLAKEALSSFREVHPASDKIVSSLATLPSVSSLYGGISYGKIDSIAAQLKSVCTRDSFWRLLLEAGVLGVVTKESAFYTEARFEYIVRERLVPNVNDTFVVHPMFHGKVGIRRPKGAPLIFPIGPEDLTVNES